LRRTFYNHADVLLGAFMRCGVQCLDAFYSQLGRTPLSDSRKVLKCLNLNKLKFGFSRR
jgi:hypothetical protein